MLSKVVFSGIIAAQLPSMVSADAKTYTMDWNAYSFEPLTLCAGDTLKFEWSGMLHDLYQGDSSSVHPECGNVGMSSPLAESAASGEHTMTITDGQEAHLYCTVYGHCSAGQAITVKGGPADCTRAGHTQTQITEVTAPAATNDDGNDNGDGNGAVGASVVVSAALATVAAIFA